MKWTKQNKKVDSTEDYSNDVDDMTDAIKDNLSAITFYNDKINSLKESERKEELKAGLKDHMNALKSNVEELEGILF